MDFIEHITLNENDNTVVAAFHGRLGNQMFEYASAKYHADKYNKKLVMQPDVYSFKYAKSRKDFFKDGTLVVNAFTVGDIPTHNEDNSVTYSEIKDSGENKNILLRGYMQSPKYWNNDREYAKRIFQPDDDVYAYIKETFPDINFEEYVSVNVRLIDNGELTESNVIHGMYNHLGILDPDYYKNAMELCGSDKKFLITSGDVDRCRNIFKGDNITFLDIPEGEGKFTRDIITMYINTLCSDNIIGNSTFSWWGAYLNIHKDRKCYYPSQFFKFTKAMDIIPDNDGWISVDAIWKNRINVIANDCTGGEVYKAFDEQFTNPFIWTVVPLKDFIKVYKLYDVMDFNKFEYVETPNYYWPWYMISIKVDNIMSIYYPHYHKSYAYDTPTLDKDSIQGQSNIKYKDIENYTIKKYKSRIARMDVDPVFIFSQETRNSEADILELLKAKSRHRLIFITSEPKYKIFESDRVKIIIKPRNEVLQATQAEWVREQCRDFIYGK